MSRRADALRGLAAIYTRELRAYVRTPVAVVFVAVFLIALGAFTWEIGGFFDAGRADLAAFFVWHPWLFVVFMPALAMRLWADERAYGTDELLLSLPVSTPALVIGKWLAAWTLAAAALALTAPMWLTVNYLGEPDNGAIALAYAVSLLMAGAYLSIGAALSAVSKSQVTAFVLSVVAGFLVTAAGWPVVLSGVGDLFGGRAADIVARFSFLTHFDAAQRGVLEIRSILYFAGFIALWLFLNGLWAVNRRRPTTSSARRFAPAAAVLAAGVFVTLNTAVQPRLSSVRLDLSADGLYTLSDGTKSALQGLAEPIDLVFAYTPEVGRNYPSINAYAARVRELLEAYAGLSDGKLRVREIDPKPFTEAEDTVLAAGLQAVPGEGADPLYFGLIGSNAVDDQLLIPFLAPEREPTLEYDLTRMIARLNDPTPPVVGVVTSLDGMSGDGAESGYYALREIARSYDVAPLAEDFVSIPERVDILLVAHATGLSDYQWDLIDQFILRKGRALFIVDPAAKAAVAGGPFGVGRGEARSDLGPLGRRWGVRLSEDAVADAANALPVQDADEAGRTSVVGQPLFIAADPSAYNDEDPVTAPLDRPVHFGAPGAIQAEPADGLVFTPLVFTGEAPAFVDSDFAAGRAAPRDVVARYDALSAPLVLAGRLSGRFESAFPEGAPAPDSDDPALIDLARNADPSAPPRLTRSEAMAEVVLIADADALDDGFYLNPAGGPPLADNAALILNALDNLAGDAALTSLRSRAPSIRPMVRVQRLRQAAEAQYLDEQSQLETRLAEIVDRLDELRRIGSAGGFFSGDLDADLTDDQRAELSRLRGEVVETRARLRDIEREYRREIDGLEGGLKALNIWGAPALAVLLALLFWRRERRGA